MATLSCTTRSAMVLLIVIFSSSPWRWCTTRGFKFPSSSRSMRKPRSAGAGAPPPRLQVPPLAEEHEEAAVRGDVFEDRAHDAGGHLFRLGRDQGLGQLREAPEDAIDFCQLGFHQRRVGGLSRGRHRAALLRLSRLLLLEEILGELPHAAYDGSRFFEHGFLLVEHDL